MSSETLIEIARLFHDTYERLAPSFGYETREDTKKFDPNSPNGKLMIAVVNQVMLSKEALNLQTLFAFEAGQKDSVQKIADDLTQLHLDTKTSSWFHKQVGNYIDRLRKSDAQEQGGDAP